MKNYNNLIINRINEILKQKNITQKVLGNGIDVSKTTVNNWLNKRSKIDAVTIKLIADFLQVPVSYFFDEDCNGGNQINGNGIMNGSNNKINVLSDKAVEKIKHLEEKLDLKENHLEEMRQRIIDKEEMIEMLKNK